MNTNIDSDFMSIMLRKSDGEFILLQHGTDGIEELSRFRKMEMLKDYLMNTGRRIRWFEDTVSDWDVFFHLRKFEDTSEYK